MQIFGHISEAGTTSRRGAALLIDEPDQPAGSLYLAIEGTSSTLSVRIVTATSGIGNGDWRLTLSTGDVVHLPHGQLPAALQDFIPKQAQRSSRLSRLENVRWRGIIILASLAILIGVGFRFVIAPLGDVVASVVPASTAQRLSNLVLSQLDMVVLHPSELDPDTKDDIQRNFNILLALAPAEYQDTKLHFRQSSLFGPNAFALPGDDIVLLDEMVTFANDNDIVIGVLAHELGHVIHQHALRQLMRSSVFTLGISVAIGSEETLIEEMASFGGSLLLAKQSRKFELEADQVSANMLRQLGRDPQALVQFFEKIQAKCGTSCDGGGFIDSHPSFDIRIDAIAE